MEMFFGDAFSKGAKTCILSKLENEEEVKKQYLVKILFWFVIQ